MGMMHDEVQSHKSLLRFKLEKKMEISTGFLPPESDCDDIYEQMSIVL
jgi:hypothetical protein